MARQTQQMSLRRRTRTKSGGGRRAVASQKEGGKNLKVGELDSQKPYKERAKEQMGKKYGSYGRKQKGGRLRALRR